MNHDATHCSDYLIGKKIKELRKKNNLSQDKLGELVACNRQKIADWERNKSEPKIEYIIKLSKVFNVSSDYLLGLSEVPNQLNTDDEKALRVSCDYTGLSPNVARYFSSHKEDYNLKVVIEFFVEYLKKHKNCVKGM